MTLAARRFASRSNFDKPIALTERVPVLELGLMCVDERTYECGGQ